MSLQSKAQAYDVLVRELFVLLDRTEDFHWCRHEIEKLIRESK